MTQTADTRNTNFDSLVSQCEQGFADNGNMVYFIDTIKLAELAIPGYWGYDASGKPNFLRYNYSTVWERMCQFVLDAGVTAYIYQREKHKFWTWEAVELASAAGYQFVIVENLS